MARFMHSGPTSRPGLSAPCSAPRRPATSFWPDSCCCCHWVHLRSRRGVRSSSRRCCALSIGGTPLSAGSIMDSMGSVRIGSLLYPSYNLVVISVGILAAIGLWWFIYRTRFGIILRATSQDRRMASALGLNVGRVYVQAFAIGCFMAGLGGAVIVPAQAAVLGMGVDALILAFVVIVIGGLGSLEGALVGALIVG